MAEIWWVRNGRFIAKVVVEGLIVNFLKKGDKEDSGNSRGITLLSVVGKVFCNDKLVQHLDEGQALHEGQGRMWRVIKRMYEASRITVLLDGEKSAAFSVEQGVAQGCSLSSILFSVFINDLLKEVEKAELGIHFGEGGRIGGMLFADDFVGLSDAAGSRLLFKFRSGTHGLNEELGRHKGREGNKECELCGNECESVSHVLWECSTYYSSSRTDFLLKLQGMGSNALMH